MSYASMRFSLWALEQVLFAMKVLIVSGLWMLECFCRCLNRLATAWMVVSAYASRFMYRSVFGMLMLRFVWDGV